MMAMDQVNRDFVLRRVESCSQTSSIGLSNRSHSFNLPGASFSQINNDCESDCVSEAGDVGDKTLSMNRLSDYGSTRENGVAVPTVEGNFLQSYGSNAIKDAVSPASRLHEGITASLSRNQANCSVENKDENKRDFSKFVEYISCLLHLAVFGILGILTRYLLQTVFGLKVAAVTSDQSLLYLDLPSIMVGSFLMGWFGVVFKANISRVSEYLAIGLSTGCLGSLTTFSGWNQKMLDLCVYGHCVSSILGFLFGLFLAAYSIIFGIETAKGFKWLCKTKNLSIISGINWRVNTYKRHLASIVVLVTMLGFLWSISGVFVQREFNTDSNGAQLWLACLVGPPGVWTRWFLARLNGRGLGKDMVLRWVPFGTLIANVGAACIMAALSTVKKVLVSWQLYPLKKVVKTETCEIVVSGIEFGTLGCLSTVSTFIAEFNAMRESNEPWRAYAYAAATICVFFGLGILIYSVPVWVLGLK